MADSAEAPLQQDPYSALRSAFLAFPVQIIAHRQSIRLAVSQESQANASLKHAKLIDAR